MATTGIAAGGGDSNFIDNECYVYADGATASTEQVLILSQIIQSDSGSSILSDARLTLPLIHLTIRLLVMKRFSLLTIQLVRNIRLSL